MPDIGGETAPAGAQTIGAPYVTYGKENRVVSTLLVARFTLEEMETYKRPMEVNSRTKLACEQSGMFARTLPLPDGPIATNVVVVSRPVEEAQLPVGYYESFVEIPMTASGMVTGIILQDRWARNVPDIGAVLMEVVAAHMTYNAAHGTAYQVQFEPDAVRYDTQSMRNASIIGSTAEADMIKLMLQELAASAYGALRFHLAVDATPGVQLAVGGWAKSWAELTIRASKPIVIIGLDIAEYTDAQGGGSPAGLVAAELGEQVVIGRTFQVPGFSDTRRVLINFPVSEETEVTAAIEACTEKAKDGHPIMVEGVKVSLVRPAAAEAVYTGPIHNKEVRDVSGSGTAAVRAQLDALRDHMQEAEHAAEEERARSAEAAEAAQAAAQASWTAQARLSAEVTRLGGETAQLAQRLAESEMARAAAEAMAGARHGETQAAAQAAAQFAEEQARAQAQAAQVQLQMQSMMVQAVARLPGPAVAPSQRAIMDAAAAVPAGGAEIVDVDMHADGGQRGAFEEAASAAASGRPGVHRAHTPRGGRHAAGISGRARLAGFLLCLTGSSPMLPAGSEPSTRSDGVGATNGRVGSEYGRLTAGGLGTVARPGWRDLLVCESLVAPVGGASRGSRSGAKSNILAGVSFEELVGAAAGSRGMSSGQRAAGAAAEDVLSGFRWLSPRGHAQTSRWRNNSNEAAHGGLSAREEAGGGERYWHGATAGGSWSAAWCLEREAAAVGGGRGRAAPAVGGGRGHKVAELGVGRGAAGEDGSRHRVAVDLARGKGPEPREGERGGDGRRRGPSCDAVPSTGDVGGGGSGGAKAGLGGGGTSSRSERVVNAGPAAQRARGHDQEQRSEAGPWQGVDGSPGNVAGGGSAVHGSAGGREDEGVGRQRARANEGYVAAAGGADAGEGQGGGGGAHRGAAEVTDAAGVARARADGKRVCGEGDSADAPQGVCAPHGHQSEVGRVEDGERADGGAGTVGGDGRRAGRPRGAGAVAQRDRDGGGGWLRNWWEGLALRRYVRRGARHHLRGRAGREMGAEPALRGCGGEVQAEARVRGLGVRGADGGALCAGERDGRPVVRAAGRDERHAVVQEVVIGAAHARRCGAGGSTEAGGAEAAARGRGLCAEGDGAVQTDYRHDRGDGVPALSPRGALRRAAIGAGQLAVRVAARAGGLRGSGR